MSLSNNVALVLVVMVSIVAVASSAAVIAILVQIVRQGGWKLAEPSVIRGRWQMVRPWLLVGAVLGLLGGIAIVFLISSDQSPHAEPVINSPPREIKSRPREMPAVNGADQTSAAPSEANSSAVSESAVPDTAKSASEDHKRIQGRWDYMTLTTGPRNSIVFSQNKFTFHVHEKTVTGTFVLDSTTQPKRIDLLFAGKLGGPDSRQGIFEFQNDLLVICLGTTAGFCPHGIQVGRKTEFDHAG